MENNELMEYYMWGVTDKIRGVKPALFNDKSANVAYAEGYKYNKSKIDDEFPTNEIILTEIKRILK